MIDRLRDSVMYTAQNTTYRIREAVRGIMTWTKNNTQPFSLAMTDCYCNFNNSLLATLLIPQDEYTEQ